MFIYTTKVSELACGPSWHMFSPAKSGWTFFPLIHTFWWRIQLCWLKEVCAVDARKPAVLLWLKMDLAQSEIFPRDSHWSRKDRKHLQVLHQLLAWATGLCSTFLAASLFQALFHRRTIILFCEFFCLPLVNFALPIFRLLPCHLASHEPSSPSLAWMQHPLLSSPRWFLNQRHARILLTVVYFHLLQLWWTEEKNTGLRDLSRLCTSRSLCLL